MTALAVSIVPFVRLHTDPQFAILALFCLAAMVGVLPFAIYRFAQGNVTAGVIDSAVVLALGGAFAYAWRGGSIGRASLVVVAITTVGCIAIGFVLGLSGALWSYPAIISNFLLVRRAPAMGASVVVVVVLAIHGGGFATSVQAWMYMVTAAVCCLFAYIFASQTRRQRQQLEELAMHDPLTGACNRRVMDRELHIAAESFRRHRLPFGLLVMDLDHFKLINDAHGHEVGDQVLIEFARIVQGRCRAGDRLFRYGGEEFVLLLPGLGADALAAFAENIRATIAAQLRVRGQPVTASIGGAVLNPGEDNAEWLARADAAMYEAKHSGRDRVVVDLPPA